MDCESDDISDYEVLRRIIKDDEYLIEKRELVRKITGNMNSDFLVNMRMVIRGLEVKNKKLTEAERESKKKQWIKVYSERVYGMVNSGDSHIFNVVTELMGYAVRKVARSLALGLDANNVRLTKECTQAEVCEWVLVEMLALSKMKKFASAYNNLKNKVISNRKSGTKFIDALFERFPKLLVGRIDFQFTTKFMKAKEDEIRREYCHKNASSINDEMTKDKERYLANGYSEFHAKFYAIDRQCEIENWFVHAEMRQITKEYFALFMNNYRKDKTFENVVGYIGKMEFGRLKGHYFHVIFFMNGHLAQRDQFVVESLGKYWCKNVAGENGIYENYDRRGLYFKTHPYKLDGVGMIERDNHVQRNILNNKVLGYLCKKEQFGRTDLSGKKFRVFFRSEMPLKRRAGCERRLKARKNGCKVER